MASTIYTQDQFLSFKEQILGKTIAKKRVTLAEIQIISESVAKYAGLTFKLDQPAFNSLMRILGISKQLRNKMIKDFGNNFVEKLIEIMSARTQGHKAELSMLVDVRKKTILNFAQGDRTMVSNTSYLSEVENIVDQYGL